jgi:hypothetical protein
MVLDGLKIRPGTEADRPYISDSIRRTLRDQPWTKELSSDAISMLIDPLLAVSETMVACPVIDESSIVGFISFQRPSTVVWLQVRAPFRRRGIGKVLVDKIGLQGANVRCPLMIGAWDGSRSFQGFCAVRGYKLRFRPYDVLEILATTKGTA